MLLPVRILESSRLDGVCEDGSGCTQSPIVSQLGRMLSCQMIVSNGWNLRLGDIRGAFLEADSLDRKQGPLYSSVPPGGIPGVPDDAVISSLETSMV